HPRHQRTADIRMSRRRTSHRLGQARTHEAPDFRADDRFRAAAARMSVLKASSSMSSPSWKSIARRVLPSRLELNSPEGSLSEAPLAKVSFTMLLYVSPVQISPSWYQTGTPLHFHSSTTS